MRAKAFSYVSSFSYYGIGYVTSDDTVNVAQWFDYAPYGSVIATTNTGLGVTTFTFAANARVNG
jgi:hypothetical protein